MSLPFGTIVVGLLAIAQIVGGIGMLFPRTARLASVVLGMVYAIFSLACIPGMIAAPMFLRAIRGFLRTVLLSGPVRSRSTRQLRRMQRERQRSAG